MLLFSKTKSKKQILNHLQALPCSYHIGKNAVIMLRLLLLSLTLSLTAAASWKGCYEEGETKAKVFKGEKTPICLLISDQSDWKEETLYYRFFFTPNVDEFTKLDVADCKYCGPAPVGWVERVITDKEGIRSLIETTWGMFDRVLVP